MIAFSALVYYRLDDPYTPAIIAGARHADCYEKLFKMRIPYEKSSVIEGFLTDEHQFLDRFAAKYYAVAHNQYHPEPEHIESRALYSEDIWDFGE